MSPPPRKGGQGVTTEPGKFTAVKDVARYSVEAVEGAAAGKEGDKGRRRREGREGGERGVAV